MRVAGILLAASLVSAASGSSALAAWVVAIDPGHGGNDAGVTLSDTLVEKQLTLAVAKDLAAALKKRGATVVLTRTDDLAATLLERATAANRKSADVFISLHIQAPQEFADGLRVYVNRFVKDEALTRSTASDVQAGFRVVPWPLAQNHWLPQSRALQTALNRSWTNGRGHRLDEHLPETLPLAVLSGVRAAAVLVELPGEAAGRGGESGVPPATVANLADGILDFLARR